jgi:hypothetical protein
LLILHHNWPFDVGVGRVCHGERMNDGDWPFVGTEALADGRVSRHSLRTRHRAVYRNVYVPTTH